MNQLQKPHPNALPSIFGWFLPKTGELLVSIRGLENPVDGYIPNRPYTTANNVEPIPEIVEVTTANNVEPIPEIVEVTAAPIIDGKDDGLNYLADNNLVTMPTSDINIETAKSTTSTKQPRTKK